MGQIIRGVQLIMFWSESSVSVIKEYIVIIRILLKQANDNVCINVDRAQELKSRLQFRGF